MEDYKEMIIEWVNTEYCYLWDTQEYINIMRNIDKISTDAYKKVNDDMSLEEEMDVVWNEIDKYKAI